MRVKFALLGGAAISAVTVQAHAQGVVPQDDSSGEAIVVLGDRLEESVPEQLEEYGSRLEIVDGRLIDEAGYVDASQALQSLVPGLYVAPKNGAFDYVNVSLAGSRSSEVLFLVDGVRISNRLYAGTTPLDTIPAHMIERIEVLKGPQALFYGTQAVGGVINIVTRSFTSQTDGSFEVGANTNDGFNINGYARGSTGDHYFVGYASHDEAEGFQPFRDADFQPSQTDRNRGYEVTTLGGRYAFEPSDSFRLTASYQHTEAELDFARAEVAAINRNDRNEEIGSLKIDWSPTERFDIFVKGYWHDWDTQYVQFFNVLGPDGQPSGELVDVYDDEIWAFEDRGVNVLGQYQATDTLALLAGYDFQEYEGRDDVFLIAPQTESVHAPFAQARFDLDNLALAAGIRHNSPSDGEDNTVWNLSGRYDDDSGFFGRALVGTAFRLPTAYELYVIDPCCETGNPNLVGESSFNTELGFGFIGDRVNVELLAFYREVEDLIGITYDLPAYPDGFLVNTDGQVKVWGGEFIVNAQLSDVFSVTLDYTHTEAEEEGTDEQIQDVPRDLAKLILNARSTDGQFGGNVAVNYVGDVFDSVSGGIGRVEHGNYAVVDLSAFAYLDRDQRHRIGVRLENLFDADYATRITRVRRNADGSSYAADNLGTPLTLHATYRLSL